MMQLTIILLIWMLPILCQSICFKVYWYVPTKNCEEFGVNFRDIPTTFGIIQNAEDNISGDQVVILHRPGLYPHIEKSATGETRRVYGGVPQHADLTKHLNAIDEYFNKTVDPNFSGLGIIDSVSNDGPEWRPIYEQNWGASTPYQEISKMMNGLDASKKFEESAQKFMNETLNRVKQLRPHASWANYDYPTCYGAHFATNTSCSWTDNSQNDKLLWLWKSQDYFMPRMHTISDTDVKAALDRVGTRMNEIERIVRANRLNKKTYFYFELHTESTVFLNKTVIKAVLQYMMDHRCGGVFLYEYSQNLDSKEKCEALLNHLNTTLGPTVKEVLQVVECPISSSIIPENTTSTSTTTDPPKDSSEEDSDEPNSQPKCAPLTVIFYVFCLYIIQILA